MAGGLVDTTDPVKAEIARLEQQIAALSQQSGQQPAGLVAPPVQPDSAKTPVGSLSPIETPPGSVALAANPQFLSKLYGTMAQYASNPEAVGNQYAQALRGFDVTNIANSPTERMLRLYGNVNPYDFSPESLNAFEQYRQRTGQLNFGLLQERERMNATKEKALSDANERAFKAEQDIGRMGYLANGFEDMLRSGQIRGGVLGSAGEWLKRLTGSEDQVTQLRTEYEQLKNKNVVQSLPPGVASDKDIEIAMRGWPGSTASPAYLAAFLRGMQKLRALDYAKALHDAEYIGRTASQRGMLENWSRNKTLYLKRAIDMAGGVYNPTNPDGSPMTAEQAADLRYQQIMGNAAGRGQPAHVTAPAQEAKPAGLLQGGSLAYPGDTMDGEDLVNFWKK